jgi:hypothetical protein
MLGTITEQVAFRASEPDGYDAALLNSGCFCISLDNDVLRAALESELVVCFVIGRTNKSDGFSCQARRKPQR